MRTDYAVATIKNYQAANSEMKLAVSRHQIFTDVAISPHLKMSVTASSSNVEVALAKIAMSRLLRTAGSADSGVVPRTSGKRY